MDEQQVFDLGFFETSPNKGDNGGGKRSWEIDEGNDFFSGGVSICLWKTSEMLYLTQYIAEEGDLTIYTRMKSSMNVEDIPAMIQSQVPFPNRKPFGRLVKNYVNRLLNLREPHLARWERLPQLAKWLNRMPRIGQVEALKAIDKLKIWKKFDYADPKGIAQFNQILVMVGIDPDPNGIDLPDE